jgi:hypothetical protein
VDGGYTRLCVIETSDKCQWSARQKRTYLRAIWAGPLRVGWARLLLRGHGRLANYPVGDVDTGGEITRERLTGNKM